MSRVKNDCADIGYSVDGTIFSGRTRMTMSFDAAALLLLVASIVIADGYELVEAFRQDHPPTVSFKQAFLLLLAIFASALILVGINRAPQRTHGALTDSHSTSRQIA